MSKKQKSNAAYIFFELQDLNDTFDFSDENVALKLIDAIEQSGLGILVTGDTCVAPFRRYKRPNKKSADNHLEALNHVKEDLDFIRSLYLSEKETVRKK